MSRVPGALHFWEKATILHQEAHRPEDKVQPSRYSRHYYDLARMAVSATKQAALVDQDLLENVVEFKKRFYYCGWAAYDLAKPGTLRLIPPGHVLEAVKADYREMRAMIFGEYLEFEVIMSRLKALEDEINGLAP